MSKSTQKPSKKQIADDIFKCITPHFSALLGSSTGMGVGTSSSIGQDFNRAIQHWLELDKPDALIGFLHTAQLTGVISEQELNSFLDAIEQTL